MSLLQSALFADPELDDLLSDSAHLSAILRFETLLAQASAEVGLIPSAAAEEIGQAIASFSLDHDALAAGLARDGVVVPSLVKGLRASLSAEHQPYLHQGATSQDAIDTAWMLQLAQIMPVLELRQGHVSSALETLSVQFGAQRLMAHTRMQAALPFTLGDKLLTWQRAIDDSSKGLKAVVDQTLVVQLGGPIGNRASFEGKGDGIAARLAALSGLDDAPPWHGNRVGLCRLGAELAALSGVLGKIGADITLMTQSEVGQAAISGGGGSSAMAHKNNPVEAELLVTLARQNAGTLGTLYQALVHENERSGAAWTLEWMTLPQIVRNVGAGLRLTQNLLSKLTFPDQGAG